MTISLRRLFSLAVVALALAPGTWLRSPIPKPDYSGGVTVSELPLLPKIEGSLALTGAWHLSSTNDHFGGYSALLWLGGDRFLAGSDQARLMRFTVDGDHVAEPALGFVPGQTENDRRLVDLEALTRDPATGTIWAAYEGRNVIERLADGGRTIARVHPPQIAGWSANSGPESLLRLRDGRFLAISEGANGWFSTNHDAVLFARDPAEGTEAFEFGIEMDDKYKPVDAKQLPDGRVMILLRHLVVGIPPSFTSALMVVDPADFEAGAKVRGTIVGRIEDPRITDNYEGLAVVPEKGGGAALYLISDDNFADFQRTLLLRLDWKPDDVPENPRQARKKARE